MKQVLIAAAFLITCCGQLAAQKFAALDKSHMDMAYFPNNFAHDRKGDDKAIIRVTYSRPAKNGREIAGKLVPYGKAWRAGANEASEIKFYQDVQLAGKPVKAGTYGLFAVPGEKEWTIILSKDLDYWGAYSYKEANDVLRVTAPVSATSAPVENFTIQFDKKGDQDGVMMLAWDQTLVTVPFKY
jgi:hypothetical protein